MIPSVERD